MVALAAVTALPVVVVAAVVMMMEGTSWLVSIVASLAMVVVNLPLVGQAVRKAVISFFP